MEIATHSRIEMANPGRTETTNEVLNLYFFRISVLLTINRMFIIPVSYIKEHAPEGRVRRYSVFQTLTPAVL